MALLIRPILAHAKLLSEPVHHERCEAPMHDSGSPSQTYSFLTLLGQSTDAMTYISTITALSLGLSGRDLPRAGLNLYTFIPIYLIYGAEGVTYGRLGPPLPVPFKCEAWLMMFRSSRGNTVRSACGYTGPYK